jgi:hypothetical protein
LGYIPVRSFPESGCIDYFIDCQGEVGYPSGDSIEEVRYQSRDIVEEIRVLIGGYYCGGAVPDLV